jgi:hypothetical protein
MPRRAELDPSANLEKLVVGLPTADSSLNVAVLYLDSTTHRWAEQVYQKVETTLGTGAVRGTWWNLGDLREPAVMAGAVSKAIRADMILLAVSTSEGLPLPFYFWVNAWLPHREAGAGALVALLGAPLPRTTESGRLKKFLRTVARRTRMELLVTERAPGALTVVESSQVNSVLGPRHA